MNRSLGRLMAIVVGAGLVAASGDARAISDTQRFSLAISGGASKGAYEAGLNWAVLKLIRESVNLETLSGGQIRPLEIASVAGASAGGVNTILTGLTSCTRAHDEGGLPNRIDDNVFRDVWLRIDINALLPPQADSPTYLPDDALFSRRDYFASARDLKEKWRKPAYRDGCRIPMGVTVTRVEPMKLKVGDIEVENQRFYIPFELRVQEEGHVAYFFDPADYPKVDDPAMILMPRPRSAPEFSISDDRIIEAAAATSAFPTAFGRRRFQYCHRLLRPDMTPSESESQQSDSDLICPEGYELDEAEFADGGLFDNLPIGLARTLAERNRGASRDPFPVTYFYIDPNRIRYEEPEPPDYTACASDNPPEACRIMEFSFFSESSLLVGALGTARRYELYRETTSDNWQLNLSQLSYQLAHILNEQQPDFACREELPYFDSPLACDQAVRRAGRFLEIAYDRLKPLVSPPYSPDALMDAGVADSCEPIPEESGSGRGIQCRIDIVAYRNQLAAALMTIIERANIDDKKLYVSISRSRQSIHDDRALRVSSRGGPITGTLLADFGSFLDFKFREYDYFVGVYDAITAISLNLCGLQFSRNQQPDDYGGCVERLGKQLYDAVGVGTDARGRYVFARLAEREFRNDGHFAFSYSPLPATDRDMQIIHDALAKALAAGEADDDDDKNVFVTESTFFEYLKEENFVPSETDDGAEPLLAQIIDDPQTWPTEMTRRFSARLVYLERQAADLYAAREPDPDLQEESYTTLMGATAHILQRATYNPPAFTFSPSTAPESWIWRYVIPYEFALDLVEGDMLLTWQPTLALSKNNLVNLRASLGFAGGLFRSSSNKNRENYLGLGLGYTRRTSSGTISSFGITPTWYHAWSQPTISDQDTLGGDINVSFMSDHLRVAVGARDLRDFGQSWFFTFGFTDLPGTMYWLTR
jgi:hypothetical protein